MSSVALAARKDPLHAVAARCSAREACGDRPSSSLHTDGVVLCRRAGLWRMRSRT